MLLPGCSLIFVPFSRDVSGRTTGRPCKCIRDLGFGEVDGMRRDARLGRGHREAYLQRAIRSEAGYEGRVWWTPPVNRGAKLGIDERDAPGAAWEVEAGTSITRVRGWSSLEKKWHHLHADFEIRCQELSDLSLGVQRVCGDAKSR